MTIFNGTSTEDMSYLDALKQSRQVQNTPSDPGSAQILQAVTQHYKNISPGLAYALASANIGPGPIANAAWQSELASKIDQPDIGTTKTIGGGKDGSGFDPVAVLTHAAKLGNYNNPAVKKGNFSQKLQDMLGELSPEEIQRYGEQAGLPQSGTSQADYSIDNLVSGQKAGKAYQAKVAADKARADQSGGIVGDVTRFATKNAALAGQAGLEAVQGYLRERAREGAAGDTGFAGVVPEAVNLRTGKYPDIKNTPMSFDEYANQITLAQEIQGKDIGTGVLPNIHSEAAMAQSEAARQASPYTIGGKMVDGKLVGEHAWSPGRAIAQTVFQPDSVPFGLASGTVDAYVAFKGDPTVLALKGLAAGKAIHAEVVPDAVLEATKGPGIGEIAKGFIAPTMKVNPESAAGAVKGGWYNVFDPTPWSSWTKETDVADVMNKWGEMNPWEIHNTAKDMQMFLPDGTKIGAQLGDSKNANEVLTTLEPHMGNQISASEVMSGSRKFDTRNLYELPDRTVKFGPEDDLDHFIRQADNAAVNLRATDADREELWNAIAYADTPKERLAPLLDLYEKVYSRMGIPDGIVQQTRQQFERDFAEAVDLGNDKLGNPQIQTSHVLLGGDDHYLVPQGDENAVMQYHLNLPDSRQVSRDTSEMSKLWNHKAIQGTTIAADAMNSIWKRMTISRIATAVRIVGEEQLRLAVTGYKSIYNHPMTLIAYAMGNSDDRWMDFFNRHAFTEPLGQAIENIKEGRAIRPYVLGDLPADDDKFMEAQNNRFSIFEDHAARERTSLIDKIPVIDPASGQVDTRAAVGIGEQLQNLHHDMVARSFITDGREATYQKLLSGELKRKMAGSSIDTELDHLEARIQNVTGGHPELIDSIGSGKVRNAQLMRANATISRAGRNEIRDILREGGNIPKEAVIQLERRTAGSATTRAVAGLDDAFNSVTDALITRPSNYFTKAPGVQQAFSEQMLRTMPYLNAEDRGRVLSMLEEANIPDRQAGVFRRIDERMTQAEATQAAKYGNTGVPGAVVHPLDFDSAVLSAKYKATADMRNLLHDLSKRNQIMDAMRIVFPFGQAWKEILGKWINIAAENPYIFRRIDQGWVAAQEPGSGVINQTAGLPKDPNQGFFFNDQFGKKVYGYPLSGKLNGLISSSLFGQSIPIPSVGKVEGLNIIGNGLPGVGPVLQIPASLINAENPTYDGIKKMLFPSGIPTSIGAAVLPGWAQKIIHAFDNPNTTHTTASTILSTATYLYSSGNYNINGNPKTDQDEINRLLHDAINGSKMLNLVRGFGQFTLPSAPSPEWLTIDKQGRLTLLHTMRDWYQKQLDKRGSTPLDAQEKFLQHFGMKNFLVTSDRSKSTIPASPIKTNAWEWTRAHPDMLAKYPKVFALFAPSGGEFSQEAYQASFERGDREAYTPEEMIRLANARLGNIAYNHVKNSMGDRLTKQDELDLRELRGHLMQEFPGYTEQPIAFTPRPVLITELQRAAQDPELAKTDAGHALNIYLEKRQQILTVANAAGISLTNKKLIPVTAWLDQWGEYLVDNYPGFQPMWDSVLKPELGNADIIKQFNALG